MRKVDLEMLKPWIATRITELLGGVEDEVLIGEPPLSAFAASFACAASHALPRRSCSCARPLAQPCAAPRAR
jgi:hypothetical protein